MHCGGKKRDEAKNAHIVCTKLALARFYENTRSQIERSEQFYQLRIECTYNSTAKLWCAHDDQRQFIWNKTCRSLANQRRTHTAGQSASQPATLSVCANSLHHSSCTQKGKGEKMQRRNTELSIERATATAAAATAQCSRFSVSYIN